MLLDAFERIEAVHGAIELVGDPTHRFAPTDTELEVQTVLVHLVERVLDECRVFFEPRRIGHVLLDVVEGVAFGLEVHVDQEVGRVVFEHEATEDELAQRAFE